jgi:hypothetical protein
MRRPTLSHVAALAVVLLVARAAAGVGADTDPLPSWNDGPAKQAIVGFVRATTRNGSGSFVPPEERVAVFDQDGTTWVEHPLYTQGMFALDRVKALAVKHPEWKHTKPFSVVLSGDEKGIGKLDESDWAKIIGATHAGMSNEAFQRIVKEWLAAAKHPRFGRPYTDLVYQPMLEVMEYLRANGFKTYIVTGGGQEFVRAYAQEVYGIPPEQVIGSSILTKYELKDGQPLLMREPKPFLIDDHGGKPVGINLFIGRRPTVAFGNSTGDAEMLRWTQARTGARLEMLVLHDDGKREYAYGPAEGLPDTKVGTFPEALLDEARKNGWTVVSMKKDWKRIFQFDELAAR